MKFKAKTSVRDKSFKFTCLKCKYQHSDPEIFRSHVISHLSEIFRCDKCFFETNRKELFVMHEQGHSLSNGVNESGTCNASRIRPLQTIPKLKCSECSFRTNSKGSFTLHSYIHKEPKFSCSFCDYKTNFEKLLKMHEETHEETQALLNLNENKLTCSSCSFVTSRERVLQKHLRMHEEQELKCSSCDFKAENKSKLADHKCEDDKIEKKKRKKCSMCNFETFDKNVFNEHKETHKTNHQNSMKTEQKASENDQHNNNIVKKKYHSWSLDEKREIYWCHQFARHSVFSKYGISQRQLKMMESRGIIDFEKITTSNPATLTSLISHLRAGNSKLTQSELEVIRHDVDNYVNTHSEEISLYTSSDATE